MQTGDKSKALRYLLEFIAIDGDWDLLLIKFVAFVVPLMEVGIRKNTKLKKVNDMIYLSSLKEVRLQL